MFLSSCASVFCAIFQRLLISSCCFVNTHIGLHLLAVVSCLCWAHGKKSAYNTNSNFTYSAVSTPHEMCPFFSICGHRYFNLYSVNGDINNNEKLSVKYLLNIKIYRNSNVLCGKNKYTHTFSSQYDYVHLLAQW